MARRLENIFLPTCQKSCTCTLALKRTKKEVTLVLNKG